MKLTLEFKRMARRAVMGQVVYTFRGRTDYPRHVTWSTSVVVIPGSDTAPKVKGEGYWKTNFNNGYGFSRTLYTPSTLRIVVGEKWNPFSAYDNDNH